MRPAVTAAVGPAQLAQELFELVLELLVEVSLLRQRHQQLADELMAGVQIVGQFSGAGRHTIIT